MINIRSQLLIWTLPFISFFGSFFLVRSYLHTEFVHTPSLVGSALPAAAKHLAALGLNVRIAAERIDDQLPIDTVLEQTPAPSQKVRPNQSVFLVISKQTPRPKTPDLRGKSKTDIKKILDHLGVRIKERTLINTSAVQDSCLFHLPEAGQPLPSEVTIFTAVRPHEQLIVDNFVRKPLMQVKKSLEQAGIQPIIRYRLGIQNEPDGSLVVIAQRPRAGTLVQPERLHQVELIVDLAD